MTSLHIVFRRVRVLLLALSCAFGVAAAQAAPAGASPAPDFVLKANSGRNTRLSEHRGEVVMINFWATWCVGCREEMPKLDALYARYHTAGFVVLGINVDEKRADAEAMIKKLGVMFPVLFDSSPADLASDFSKFRTARLYQVKKMPATLLVDRNGLVRYVHGGYSRGDEEEYDQKIRELLKE